MYTFLPALDKLVGQTSIDFPSFCIITPLYFKNLLQVIPDAPVKNRTCYLDPVIKISCHEVCRRDVIFLIAPITEYHESGMFKKTIDNADCLNVLTYFLYSRDQ